MSILSKQKLQIYKKNFFIKIIDLSDLFSVIYTKHHKKAKIQIFWIFKPGIN